MNKTSFIVIAAAGLLMTMAATAMGSMMSTTAAVQAETFEVSDHPTSMQILELINMYNEDNPNSPIVCSSGFVFPQESHGSSSSSTTSIVNQVGQAIHEAVDGVHVPTVNNHHGNQETADMAKRTSTPVSVVADSDDNGGGDESGNGAGSDDNSDDNDGGDSSSGDSSSSDSSSGDSK